MKPFFRGTYLFIGCILCSFFLWMHPLYSQPVPLIFRHLKVEDGLSDGTVNAIYQDKRGFMWFGTDNGLNKYDGSGFTVYQNDVSDSLSISSNIITAIFEDSYDNFWIGTDAMGLNRFDRDKDIFICYKHDPNLKGSISNNNIRVVFEDSRKNLWIGTAGGGLNLYDRQSDSFSNFNNDSLSTSDIGCDYVSSIVEDKNGYLWLGSTEGILVKFDITTMKGHIFRLFNGSTKLSHVDYNHIYIDSENNIWFGTENGFYIYDQKKSAFQHFVKGTTNKNLNADLITGILEYQNGLYMITTILGGLNIYNKKTDTFTYQMSSKLNETNINDDQLCSIYKSSDGIIWIGSYGSGLNILDVSNNRFQKFQNLVDPSEYLDNRKPVKAICEDKDKNIWIGNASGLGIDIIDPKTYEVRHPYTDKNNPNSILNNTIFELYRDRNDDIWIGTFLNGMSRYDWKSKRFYNYRHDPKDPKSLGGDNVFSIVEETEDVFWIALMGNGLDRFDRKTNTFTHYINNPDDPKSLSHNDVYKVALDNKGQIWVGTRSGLCILDKSTGTFTRFMSEGDTIKGIFGDYIHNIYQDNSGRMWIGTDKALNLYHPENNTFEHFTEKDGLTGNTILNIVSDKNGNIWISTNKGLSMYNIREKKFRNYDALDGLQSNEFSISTALKYYNDKLYFGSKYGLTIFDPDNIKDNPLIPPVYFTQMTVSNMPVSPRQKNSILTKHINFEKRIVLAHKQSSEISFEFAALNYSNPQKNQYAYWLEGFDKNWRYISNKHEVTYTNLDPGKYVLKVKGSNNDGIWNEEGARLEIIILPPWWATWWFRLIMAILAAALLLGIYYMRLQTLRKQKKMLEEKVDHRTRALNEANKSLSEQHEELRQQNELLNEMSQKILNQNKELELHYSELERLVGERTAELEKAKNRAEESDRLKSAFLANMSHEIRTPMNAIVGFANLLKDETLTMEEKTEFVEIINSNSDTLLTLIDDILDLSMIEANQLIIKNEVFSLNETLDHLYSSYSLMKSRAKVVIQLNNELHAINLKIRCDKIRIRQIVTNLMNNAVKFTGHGIIELGLKKQDGNLAIYVKDTGIGISKDEMGGVFERFRKSDMEKSTLYRGAGLGLAISKALARLLGGNLKVESELGKGSTFTLLLPDTVVSHEEPIVKEILVQTDKQSLFNKNILIVEDEKANYMYVQKMLGKSGMNVHYAENGLIAVKLMESGIHYNIVLMDIKMPVMDGFEATQIIKSKNPEQIVIALTAYARPEDRRRFMEAGFNDYLTKPIKPNDFTGVIQRFL